MDARRFDAWVKGLPTVVPPHRRLWATRRGVLRGVAGSALAAVLGGGGPAGGRVASAAGEGICDHGCGSLCEPIPALLNCNFTNPDCACLKSTSGEVVCTDSGVGCPVAGAADECQQDSDCPANAICVRTAGGICCTAPTEAQVNRCMPRCLNLTTASASSRQDRHGSSLIDGARKRL